MRPVHHNAIAMHGIANNSDPFARKRMGQHLARGIANPREVIKQAETVIKARAAETGDTAFSAALSEMRAAMRVVVKRTKSAKRKTLGASQFLRGAKDADFINQAVA